MSSPTSAYTPKEQWMVVLLSATANLVNQADRIVMSIAIVPMSYELGLRAYDQGWILSSFAYGYITTQVVAGPLSEKHGPGRVLVAALGGWCTLTVLTPIFAAQGLSLLLTARVLMGICEGFCWPSTYTWISHTVSSSRRSRSFALLIAGGSAGQLIALLVCPTLLWPTMFLIFGLLGFFWVSLFCMSSVPTPGNPETQIFSSVHIYARMLKTRPVLAILAAHFTHNWGHTLLVSWLPTYLHTVLGVQKEALGIVAIPLGLCVLASPVYGTIADYLHHTKGISLLVVRRMLSAIGMLGPAVIFLIFPYAQTQWMAIVLVSLIFILYGCMSSGVFSNHADILPTHAGMAFGLGNTIATIPGLVIGPFTAYLISHGNNWYPVFLTSAVLNVIGAAVFCTLSEVESVEHLLEPEGEEVKTPL
eukprot:TRINITY_DN18516_c0_g1_i1.p1 TRINITY_DN18516_c0_g1~~TRINITY_DN18516_c0_g1_i1.p1  ORF type:complete len:432 (+),score=67.27 TRINITY_DN18516_c0_g1_i1:42-1298(+)